MNWRFYLVLFLLIAISVPTGFRNPSPLVFVGKALLRLQVPITEREQQELEFLACVEHVGLVIPDRANVKIDGSTEGYLRQRAQDLLYPRVRLVDTEFDYVFSIGRDQDPKGVLMNSANCDGLRYEVFDVR